VLRTLKGDELDGLENHVVGCVLLFGLWVWVGRMLLSERWEKDRGAKVMKEQDLLCPSPRELGLSQQFDLTTCRAIRTPLFCSPPLSVRPSDFA